ncbi:hypothetical protein PENPOL_c001G00221 [Penicillium polonicum]|uniref:Uncharacterized protein n=1 Tax=Penicillium polonicum TaxID=60169 RepID=A0A1V6P2L9_PENPO|nr:hypothetical protein PENPOL_c001G00221 [Penicillium polonicum]
MSTTRYTVPIPESMLILETRQLLNDMAMQFPLGTVDDRNGGYYLLDHDATVLAVASDSLCEELDASMEAAKRYHTLACQSALEPIHAATHMPSVGPTAIAMCAQVATIGVSEHAYEKDDADNPCVREERC